jgi:hypothetical protein
MHCHFRLSWLALALIATGCGDDEAAPAGDDPLPPEPQILPNPSTGFLTFPLIPAGGSSELPMVFGNGGEADLELESFTLSGPGAGSFVLGDATDTTVEARHAASLPVTFDPATRGIHQAVLTVISNAENRPTLTVQLVGPAALSMSSNEADIEVLEDAADATFFDSQGQQVALVRFMNIGPAVLNVLGYAISNDTDDAFALPSNVSTFDGCAGYACDGSLPIGCQPIEVGAGAFVLLQVEYGPPATGTHTATLTIVSDDPDTCEIDVALSGTN